MDADDKKWLRSIERRFELFDSPGECAAAAAPVFKRQRWSWSGVGIPDEMEIRQNLMRQGRGESGRLVRSPDGRYGYQKPIVRTESHLSHEPFDRKTFNPETNSKHYNSLRILRNIGRVRRYGSGALKCLPAFVERAERRGTETYVDFGCGDSPDTVIAQRLGYTSCGFDLFPPMEGADKRCADLFCRADVAEPLPLADCSVDFATSNAMIDLIPIAERAGFYSEVFRVLKVGGVFVQVGISLHCGHGYNAGKESSRVREIKEWDISGLYTASGFRAIKKLVPLQTTKEHQP